MKYVMGQEWEIFNLRYISRIKIYKNEIYGISRIKPASYEDTGEKRHTFYEGNNASKVFDMFIKAIAENKDFFDFDDAGEYVKRHTPTAQIK